MICQQSVRHHLSLNRLFERQPRPATDPGFGSYWTVNLAAPPGTKRPRKRGRPNKDPRPKNIDAVQEGPFKPRRGRSRKDDPPAPPSSLLQMDPPIDPALLEPSITLSGPPIHLLDDGELNMLVHEDELMDEPPHPMQILASPTLSPRQRLSRTVTPLRVQSALPHNTSPLLQVEPEPMQVIEHELLPLDEPAWGGPPQQYSVPPDGDKEELIEQLQTEMANLRRSCAVQFNDCVRLAHKLTRTQRELDRTRSALEAAQAMCREEYNRRVGAEGVRDDALRLREEGFKSTQFHFERPRSTR